ncbi:helix-turn-helix domain-containing protein [Anaerobaca lacustris]|uniref:helix-turn-helix domain-containing protein n=1 Tax=Anaerobaca lacustris TaxID=3044600 RepID=UPI003D76844C
MILEGIRQAIADSGISRYQIAQETGVHQTVLWRIVHGGGCSLETANVLCEYLGLELKSRGRKRRKQ